jgi:hypothetical protein
MEYIILIFVLLAMLHFWYEAIIAPSERLRVRFRLFELRDEARRLKISYGNKLEDRHFHYLQEAINGLIRNVEHIDLGLLVSVKKKTLTDKQFKARVEANAKILEDCNVPEAVEIRKKAHKLIAQSLTINSGGWMFYIIPVALAALCYSMTAKLIRFICAMPEPELDKFVKRKAAAGSAR